AFNILTAERTALNFLSLLSGIASYTYKFVKKIEKTKAKIRDTRKTTPLLRALEKYAVRVGGGFNHREGLWDGILIKDNHLRAAGIIKNKKIDKKKILEMFKMMKENTSLEIEIEVENLSQFRKVIACLPDIVLLDNFSFPQIKKAVVFRDKFFPQVKLEVSGGINLDNVEKIACLGVDFIAVGSITHSPKAVDFSLEVDG
ncbi:MAG: carboxylating nicotinate-nucleotide diphosphorylase, partial [Candidatus Omnitrophota bacterium]